MSTILSYDPQELKTLLIQFLRSKETFEDFNFEGSAINTIIDLLVRNTHFIAYMANMVATESFLDSAQLRPNVISHAQKLSYVSRSRTASTLKARLEVVPVDTPPSGTFYITANKGSAFIVSVDNNTYQFTNREAVELYRTALNTFIAEDIELKQGQLVSEQFTYSGQPIVISNKDIDTSTLKVFVFAPESSVKTEFSPAGSIVDVERTSSVFYVSENYQERFQIEFGKGILGVEPEIDSVIQVEYISCEKEHGNGITELYAASSIGGYSNIDITVTVPGFGGAEKPSIEYIKFIAPKTYESQNRAVRESDYAIIMKREFPFIKSAISWGGEKNVPPYYGKVFLSAIPEDGFIIADVVKSIIENKIKEFSMLQPEVVDAKFIGLNLNVGIMFDQKKTSSTFTQISTNVKSKLNDYNDKIKSFEFWYNNSEASDIIKSSDKSIVSVEIEKTAEYQINSVANTYLKYDIEFLNPIKPGSLLIKDGVVLDTLASNQYICDDENGNVVKKITKNEVETETVIGTIDYEVGLVSFNEMFLTNGTLTVNIEPEGQNFYTERNFVVYLKNVITKKIEDKK